MPYLGIHEYLHLKLSFFHDLLNSSAALASNYFIHGYCRNTEEQIAGLTCVNDTKLITLHILASVCTVLHLVRLMFYVKAMSAKAFESNKGATEP